MKKAVKRSLLAVGLIILLLVIVIGIYFYPMIIDMRAMTPVASMEIAPGIFAIKDAYVNLYLIKGAGRYIAFDAGVDPARIRTEMSKFNIIPDEVAAVFLTHADSDHTGGLSLFPHAQIYLAKEEEQMINGKTARFLFFKNKLKRTCILLDDDASLDLDGLKITTILTPGHTPGSMSYLLDGQYLFTGDSMSLKAGVADIFSKHINMDNDAQRASLKKLAALKGIKGVFTAHHGYTDSYDAAMRNYK